VAVAAASAATDAQHTTAGKLNITVKSGAEISACDQCVVQSNCRLGMCRVCVLTNCCCGHIHCDRSYCGASCWCRGWCSGCSCGQLCNSWWCCHCCWCVQGQQWGIFCDLVAGVGHCTERTAAGGRGEWPGRTAAGLQASATASRSRPCSRCNPPCPAWRWLREAGDCLVSS
jgi:hypothetical protein